MERTFEIQNGYLYVYMDGQLAQIQKDTPEWRTYLARNGYTQHNKFEREKLRVVK